MKAIILARVSSEEQKQSGLSLPAQQRRLEKYALSKGLEIEKVYCFDESAFKTKREEFNKIVAELKDRKDIVALCCDKIDRLIRNFTRELVDLEQLRAEGKIELHFPSDNIILHKDSPASDLFRFTIGVSLAKYYSDSISDNVKRAIEQKLKNREWPGKAPYGYKNITKGEDKKDIVIDEFASKVVKKMYEWYSTSAYSLLLIREKLKNDHNIKFSKGYIDAIMKNPFYYGVMRYNGNLYPHRYEPVITKELFDKVQEIKAGYNKKHFKYAGLPYMYRGLIRCADCGCMITPEKAKDKYVYYHCTQYKGKHGAEWLREENITEQIAQVFKKLQIPQDVLEDITSSLRSVHRGKSEFREQQYKELTKEKDRYAKRIENMYLDKLDGRITTDEYDKLYKEFRGKIDETDSRLANLQKAEDEYYITAIYLLELANKAYDLFKSSEIEEKRQLLKLTLQNLVLSGKKVQFQVQKPFDTILNFADSPSWLLGLDSNQEPFA